MQPDVIQVQLAEEEERRFVTRLFGQDGARRGLADHRILQERVDQALAFGAFLERFPLVLRVAERAFDLEMKRRRPELAGFEIPCLARLEHERGGLFITGAIEGRLRIGQRTLGSDCQGWGPEYPDAGRQESGRPGRRRARIGKSVVS